MSMCRSSGLSVALLLMVMKSCIVFIVIYQSFILLVQPYLLDIKLYGRNHLIAFVTEYAFFSSTMVIIDIITFLLLLNGNYETVKYYLIITILCQLIILLPFAISGFLLTVTAAEAPARAFGCSWIDKFHLIHRYSSKLIPPKDSINLTAVEQDLNSSIATEDVTGVRDLFENRQLIRKLDRYLKTADLVQRQLECCGVEGSHEWLSLYSGTFTHHKKTKQDLWWSDSWLPMRFTRSCCPVSNILCSIYQETNQKKQPYYQKRVVGCRRKAVREIVKGIRVICSFLITAIFIQLILSPLIYFLMERRRQIERALYIVRWKRHLEVILQEEKKEATRQKNLLKTRAASRRQREIVS